MKWWNYADNSTSITFGGARRHEKDENRTTTTNSLPHSNFNTRVLRSDENSTYSLERSVAVSSKPNDIVINENVGPVVYELQNIDQPETQAISTNVRRSGSNYIFSGRADGEMVAIVNMHQVDEHICIDQMKLTIFIEPSMKKMVRMNAISSRERKRTRTQSTQTF